MINKGRDIQEIGFVVSLWKNMTNYRNYIKQIDPEAFFMYETTKVFYVIGRKMFESGYTSIDRASVTAFLANIPALENLFIKHGGYQSYEDFQGQISDYKNVEGYYINVQKSVVLNNLKSVGIDVDGNYDKLSIMTVEQIRKFYSFHINNSLMGVTSKIEMEALEITLEDIEYFSSGEGMGFQFGHIAPILNYEILGLDKGLSFVGGMTNAGKTSFVMAIFVRAWIQSKIKTCIISNEQTVMEFKRLLIAMVGYELFGDRSLSRRSIKRGDFTPEQKDMMYKIMEHSNKAYGPYLKFCKIYDYSLEDVELIIDTQSALGFEAYIYDVFKADDDADKAVIGEMKKASKALFKCADRNEVTVLATVQLGVSFENVRYTGLSTISTSKQIVEPAHTVTLLRTLWDDEITGGKYDVKAWRYKLNSEGQKIPKGDGTFVKEDVVINEGDHERYKLCFIAKTRNGELGTVILYEFLGDFNIWVECGYCTKVHRKNRGQQK